MHIPFGKHKGEDTSDVPISYLRWLEEQDWISDALREDCQYEIERREGDRSSFGRKTKDSVA